jgi:SSS family solute:Na+ symporter
MLIDTPLWLTLTVGDWVIFFSTILLTVLAACYRLLRRKKITNNNQQLQYSQNSWAEYMLMGRRLTLPLFVATLVATWYGDILGVTQIAFEYGIYTFLTQGIFWYLSYILFAILLAKYIRKMQILSFPDLVAKLIGRGPSKFSAILIFLKTLPVTYAIGIGIFLKTLFPLSFSVALGLGLLFVFVYSLFGGFGAIVFSDLVQVICMYIGIISVVVISFLKFGGISYLVANCPREHFSIHGTFSVLDTFVWFFIALSTTFLNPTFYQRCLSARTDKVAVWGIFISIFCWIIFDICTTLIGLYAKAYLPHLAPLNASLQYCLAILPSGLKGLFLGAVLATILSTLDSFLFISSTTLMYDLRLMFFRSKFLAHLCASLITGSLTFFIVIFYQGSFEMAWRILKGIFAACIFPPFILSYFKPYVINTYLFTISCFSVVIGMLAWDMYKPFPIDAFYIGQGVSFITLIMGILLKHLGKKLRDKIKI